MRVADSGSTFRSMRWRNGTPRRWQMAMASFNVTGPVSPYVYSIMAVFSLIADSSSATLCTITSLAPVSAIPRSQGLRCVMMTSFFIPSVSGSR